jgi:hypothetical protein
MISFIKSLIKKISKTSPQNILKPDTNLPIEKSTVILVPVGSSIEPPVDDALRKLESIGYTVWRRYGWSAIDQGRCVMAQEALDAGFEHLFWIDADVCFWPYDVEKTINLGLPFVSAPYSVKGWPVLTTQFKQKNVKLGTNGGLYEISYAATGFMYTHRSVYEKMAKDLNMEKVKIWGGQYNVYPYFYPLLIDGEYLGEDFAFCHKLKQIGIKLYSDTRIKLSHIGKYSYSYGFINNGPIEEPKFVNYNQNDDLKFS